MRGSVEHGEERLTWLFAVPTAMGDFAGPARSAPNVTFARPRLNHPCLSRRHSRNGPACDDPESTASGGTATKPLGRISIRRWAAEDAVQLASLYARNRDEILVTEPWRTAEYFTMAGQLVRIRNAAHQDPPFKGWLLLEDDVIAGTVGLDHITDGWGTLGYWMDASRRARGVATAGVGLVLDEVFNTMALQGVAANTLPENIASIALLRRLGFEAAGSVMLEHGGKHLRFVLLRQSWYQRAPN